MNTRSNSLNGSCDRYGSTKIFFEIGASEVEEAWKTVGIEANFDNALCGKNVYKLNGKQISQEEARQHAMKVTGHYMNESDWKW